MRAGGAILYYESKTFLLALSGFSKSCWLHSLRLVLFPLIFGVENNKQGFCFVFSVKPRFFARVISKGI